MSQRHSKQGHLFGGGHNQLYCDEFDHMINEVMRTTVGATICAALSTTTKLHLNEMQLCHLHHVDGWYSNIVIKSQENPSQPSNSRRALILS